MCYATGNAMQNAQLRTAASAAAATATTTEGT